MSVNIVPTQQPGTWLQRLTGTEPRTVVEERSTTTVSSVAGGSFNFRTALRNGGIGAAIAGALGGVSLLGKVALPLIGKVASVGGLARLAGVGGAIGLATAALPIIVPALQRNPTAKAAAVGAGIGAAAGLVLPFVPIWLGAGIGAGVGLLIHNRRTHPAPTYEQYPGYEARPGYVPYGTGTGPVPAGLVPVTPNYGSYAGAAMNPYGVGGYGGYGSPAIGGYGGYGTAGYPVASGYGNPLSLPMQAQGQVPAAVGVPAAARPAPAAARPAVGAPVP
ncbi:MAG: hypothetical protein JWM98_3153, partial [Thermoleophilia bacterium]|nr:hypothetical protein [Thermoleophilia bacterium]